MASLAPGNGWFPHRGFPRNYNGRGARKQPVHGSGRIYELRRIGFPFIPTATASVAKGSGTSNIPNRLATTPIDDSRAAASMLAWGMFAAVLGLIVWVGLMAAYAGGVVAMGVPWTTVAVAMAGVHVLLGILLMLFFARIGCTLWWFPDARNPRRPEHAKAR